MVIYLMKNHIFLFFVFSFFIINSQNNSTYIKLKEVVVEADKGLKKNSKTYKVTSINDSVIINNLESFTSLLRFNSPIYMKEYGQGGTSSASFRGTSSSNTAVMWNGININSINNGQTEFNSLTVGLHDAIDIRSGGGSIEYGSGAIGGTIHLKDLLFFSDSKKIKNQLVSSVGSFKTFHSLYKLLYSSKKYALKFGVSSNLSDNDYPFINSEYKNYNGAYNNYSVNFSNSYKLSKHFLLNFYTMYYFGDRLFSGELPNPTSANSRYKDISQRNLASLHYNKEKISVVTRLGYLFQEYQFFQDKENIDYNFGNSKRGFADVTINFKLPLNATLSSSTKYESTFGKTDMIKVKNRRELSQSLIFSHAVTPYVFYDLKLRKDINSDYKVPISYSFGFKIKPFRSFFVRANTSKNYRVPTYNDLFWPNQGNKNLIPESSLQGEFGGGYKGKNIFFDIAYFTIYSKDNIVWSPNGDPERPGVWVPINLEKTKNKGIELSISSKYTVTKNFMVSTSLNYVYVNAKNEKNNSFLMFIPKHLTNFSVAFYINRLSIFFQNLFNGKVYTTEETSEDDVLDSFNVLNSGIDYEIINKGNNYSLSVGLKINNVLNKNYVVLSRRPMPGTNYNFNINYKF